jgi:hypothetical protein
MARTVRNTDPVKKAGRKDGFRHRYVICHSYTKCFLIEDPKNNIPRYLNDLYILHITHTGQKEFWELPVTSGEPPSRKAWNIK